MNKTIKTKTTWQVDLNSLSLVEKCFLVEKLGMFTPGPHHISILDTLGCTQHVLYVSKACRTTKQTRLETKIMSGCVNHFAVLICTPGWRETMLE